MSWSEADFFETKLNKNWSANAAPKVIASATIVLVVNTCKKARVDPKRGERIYYVLLRFCGICNILSVQLFLH